MPFWDGLKNMSQPSCRCCKVRWRDIYTREVLACMACLSLSVFLLFGIATPWYTVTGIGMAPPLDTVQSIFYWTGMENVYVPPLNGQRTISLSWDSMDSRMPKDIYMSCMAMGILAWVATQVLLVAILFGLVCRGTGRMFYLLSCGCFKWIVVLISLIVLVLVLLSWTIFFMFNRALTEAKLCYGHPTYFPSGNITVPCEGLWCGGFAGTALAGGARFAWGPTAGWVSTLCGTIHIFFILCVVLSVDPGKFSLNNYEEIGEKRRKKKKKLGVRKRSPEEIKLARQRSRMASEEDSEDSEQELRRPLRRGGGSRSDSGRPKRASRMRQEEGEEEDFASNKRVARSGGRRSSRRV